MAGSARVNEQLHVERFWGVLVDMIYAVMSGILDPSAFFTRVLDYAAYVTTVLDPAAYFTTVLDPAAAFTFVFDPAAASIMVPGSWWYTILSSEYPSTYSGSLVSAL